MSRLSELLQRLSSYAPRVAIESEACSHTYADILEEKQRWQVRLDTLDVGDGDVVALRADYSLAAIAALLALFERKAVAALIPRDHSSGRYLSDCGARGLLQFDADGGCQWQPLPQSGRHPLLDTLRETGDAGIVIFTSGSTGRPKAALQNFEHFLHKMMRKVGDRYRTLAFWLFDHVAGMDTLFLTLAAGGSLILTPRRDPATVLCAIERHAVELLPTSPSFLRLMCAAPQGTYDLSSLQVIVYGSELMDPTTLARVNARFPGARILQKYGTTETGAPREVSRSNESLWFKITGAETKVVDDVLWMRGEGMILGYLNAPSPIDPDGWYCTGDLVDVDGEWIRIRGRTVDVINVGGEKVMPAEVEERILELPFIRDVAVTGEAHELMGQVVTARVQLSKEINHKEAAARIRAHCRQHLALYKVPVRIEVTAEAFTNARQKVQRRRADRSRIDS